MHACVGTTYYVKELGAQYARFGRFKDAAQGDYGEDFISSLAIDGIEQRSWLCAVPYGARALKRWDVTRRIQRMNRKLRLELDQTAAEKHGHKWALTSFMHNIWTSLTKIGLCNTDLLFR